MKRLEELRRVAIVGTGHIAEWHARALHQVRGVSLVAACDINLARARDFAVRHHIPVVYGSIADLVQHKPLDVVHVLLPAESHVEAATTLVESGLDVLLEKPMGIRAEECEMLRQAAERHGVQLSVSLNYLHSEVYERLRRDVRGGRLGKIEEVRITWNRELAPIAVGPFDGWLFHRPENVMLEIGPHSVAHLLDLLDAPQIVNVSATCPLELPNGKRFYRKWRVEATFGTVAAELSFSLGPGFTEHEVHVRGSLAAATADFERNTYVFHHHTRHSHDLDRVFRVTREANTVRRQAMANLLATVASKWTKSSRGNPFGATIARSVQAYYNSGMEKPDPRHSPILGRDVVAFCQKIGEAAELPRSKPTGYEGVRPTASRRPTILLLGATGFIGREIVRQLVDRGRACRVLVRKPGGLALTFNPRLVEVLTGDASNTEDLSRALEGITHVVHLARAQAKTWAEYRQNDVEMTRHIAEACLSRRVSRLVYASSIVALYTGKHAGTITDRTPALPSSTLRDPYAKSKSANEELLLDMHRRSQLPAVIVRPGIVLGRGGSPFHFGVAFWRRNSICQFYGDGTNPLPIILVGDVASGIISALDVPGIDGESFNLVGEPCLTARDYIEELERFSRYRFEKFPTPILRYYLGDLAMWIVKVLVRHQDLRRLGYWEWETRTRSALFNNTMARERLRWNPIVDRDEIVRRGIHEPMADLLR